MKHEKRILIIATFYLSIVNGGNPQRQLDGLYRALHDILRQRRSALKEALSDAWTQSVESMRKQKQKHQGTGYDTEMGLSSSDVARALRNI